MCKNLDAMEWDDLDTFWRLVNEDAPAQAVKIFPGQPVGYVEATEQLALYAETKKTAMQKRAAGEIPQAEDLEEACEDIYVRLPKFAQW